VKPIIYFHVLQVSLLVESILWINTSATFDSIQPLKLIEPYYTDRVIPRLPLSRTVANGYPVSTWPGRLPSGRLPTVITNSLLAVTFVTDWWYSFP